jgi:hypothetical protein
MILPPPPPPDWGVIATPELRSMSKEFVAVIGGARSRVRNTRNTTPNNCRSRSHLGDHTPLGGFVLPLRERGDEAAFRVSSGLPKLRRGWNRVRWRRKRAGLHPVLIAARREGPSADSAGSRHRSSQTGSRTKSLRRSESRPSRVCWDSSGIYHSCSQMDHGGEALIGLVGAHCDAFELLELAEEVLD